MRKSKFTAEEKLKLKRKYLKGEDSATAISEECSIARASLMCWVNNYTAQWLAALHPKAHNLSYSKDFKLACVIKPHSDWKMPVQTAGNR